MLIKSIFNSNNKIKLIKIKHGNILLFTFFRIYFQIEQQIHVNILHGHEKIKHLARLKIRFPPFS